MLTVLDTISQSYEEHILHGVAEVGKRRHALAVKELKQCVEDPHFCDNFHTEIEV